jgi:hypothetical protein
MGRNVWFIKLTLVNRQHMRKLEKFIKDVGFEKLMCGLNDFWKFSGEGASVSKDTGDMPGTMDTRKFAGGYTLIVDDASS